MVQAFEMFTVFASRCFCAPQKQKGVADAVIEAGKPTCFSIRSIRLQALSGSNIRHISIIVYYYF